MPDRSSRQDLPDDWNRGRRAARGQHSAGKAADGHEPGPAGSHRAGFGGGPGDGYGAASTDPLRPRADSYGGGMNDGFAAGPGGGTAERFGAADPFGDAPSFGTEPSFGDAGALGDTRTFAATGAARDAGAAPYANGEPYGNAGSFGDAGTSGAGTSGAGAGRGYHTAATGPVLTSDGADGKGFLGALFDFGFTSFVTPKVIKVLYALITIGTVVSALAFTIIAFKASPAFGVATLIFGDPLFILIVLAIYRVILEFFMVTFRVAEDIRVLRDRGTLS